MWQYVNTNIILSLGYLLYFLYAGYGYSWETHLPEIVCLKIIMLKSSGCSKSQQWLRGSHMWLYLCVSLSQCWINKRIETRWPTKSVTKNKAVLYCKRVSYVTITLDCSLFLFPPPFFFFFWIKNPFGLENVNSIYYASKHNSSALRASKLNKRLFISTQHFLFFVTCSIWRVEVICQELYSS